MTARHRATVHHFQFLHNDYVLETSNFINSKQCIQFNTGNNLQQENPIQTLVLDVVILYWFNLIVKLLK